MMDDVGGMTTEAFLREMITDPNDGEAFWLAYLDAQAKQEQRYEDEAKRLRAENAALREIAEAVAKFPLWWHHMRPLYFECPACREEVPVGVDATDRPSKVTMDEAEAHFVHAPNCPILKARAALAPKE